MIDFILRVLAFLLFWGMVTYIATQRRHFPHLIAVRLPKALRVVFFGPIKRNKYILVFVLLQLIVYLQAIELIIINASNINEEVIRRISYYLKFTTYISIVVTTIIGLIKNKRRRFR